MLTKLVTALACEDFVQDERGMSLIGVAGDTIPVSSKPGFVRAHIFLSAESDGRGGKGKLVLRAAEYEETIPYEVPPGVRQTGFVPVITVPVLKEGVLSVRLLDDHPKAKPLTAKWRLVFAEDAQVLPEGVGAEILDMTR